MHLNENESYFTEFDFWQGVNNRKNFQYAIYFPRHYVNQIRMPAIMPPSVLYFLYQYTFLFI